MGNNSKIQSPNDSINIEAKKEYNEGNKDGKPNALIYMQENTAI